MRWFLSGVPARWRAWRSILTSTRLAVVAGVFFALTANTGSLSAELAGRDPWTAASWLFAVLLVATLAALHVLLLSAVLVRLIARPLLGLLIAITAFATSYIQRFGGFRRLTPTCDTGELHQCTREQVVNAYDNALLFTDHVLAKTIGFLQSQSQRFDTTLVFVSDHGESLGEKGLLLHGVPYAIAPDEQTQVPMSWWLSPGYAASFGLDTACLRSEAAAARTHDHLFHTVLGLLQVRSREYENALDTTRPCRR